MIATKTTVTITVEVLDLAVVPALIEQVASLIDDETDSGTISKTDGDTATWLTKRTDVAF